MKNKITKQTRKDIKGFYKKIAKSKITRFFLILPLWVRIILSFLLFLYGIIAFIIPFLPFGTISLVLGIIFIYPNIRKIQGKTLYYLNVSGLKRKMINTYIHYKNFRRKK